MKIYKIIYCALIIILVHISNRIIAGDIIILEQPANCYIISASGEYSFPAVRGNSYKSVGEIALVDVAWASSNDIIESISYDASINMINISTPSQILNGNAVIYAMDTMGDILWSWHIWICNGYDPIATAHLYYNDAGIMMDRNLGAISAIPGDQGTFGLYYQWGRKDPFPNPDHNVYTKLQISNIPASVLNNAIIYSVSHPTTFITTFGNETDWDLQGENTRWDSLKKSEYDPCPSGWRIPGAIDGCTIWAKACNHFSFESLYNREQHGKDFSTIFGASDSIWYPSSGCLDFLSGKIYLPSSGFWWSSVFDNDLPCAFSTANYGTNITMSPCNKAYGFSVRCVKEVK